MRKTLAMVALLCGAVGASAATADEPDELQNWCSKDGQTINQVENLFIKDNIDLDDEDIHFDPYKLIVTYDGKVFVPCP